MRSVIDLVIRYLRENVPKGKIYFVGSLATGETTNIRINNYTQIPVSDFDVIIFVDALTYIRSFILHLANKLSRAVTSELKAKGLKTHVSIAIVSPTIFKFFPSFAPNTIYLHEMRRVLWDHGTFHLSFHEFHVQLDKLDCINLIFSALADYLFVKFCSFKKLTVYEKCYIVAKRYATLVYSFLLFKGNRPRGYYSTLKQAREHFEKYRHIISTIELEILDASVRYKISGDERIFYEKLPLKRKNIREVFIFLCNSFEKLALKILWYELSEYFNIGSDHHLTKNFDELLELLGMYKLRIKLSLAKCFIYAILYLISFLKEGNHKKLKFVLHILLKKRLKIGDFLRYLTGKLFLSASISSESKVKLKHLISNLKTLWDTFMI